MSIVDHFEHSPDAGFTHRITAETARRQFNMSLGLVVVLATATMGAALSLGITPRDPVDMSKVRLVVQAPQIVHVQHASREAARPDS